MVANATYVSTGPQDESSGRRRYIRSVARADNLTTERFRLLLADLRATYIAEHGHDHGWITAAADLIGRHRSGISAVWAGTKGIGPSTAEKARERLKLPAGFFMDPDFDAKAWLEERAGGVRMQERPATPEDQRGPFHEFVERFGDRYSDKTIEALEGGLFHRDGRVKTVGDYIDTADQLEKVWSGEAEIVIRPKES